MTAALADVKILDFMWVMAGPAATRVLADYGATVVRIESTRRIDTARTLAPYRDGNLGAENSACFQNLNAGKRLMTLDLATDAGRRVALDLVRWADAVTESFTPGTMQRLGLGYEAVRTVKSDLVMLSTCLMGQTGPLAGFSGYGNLAAAISGFSNLGGWPDRAPAGPVSAYTDYVSPRFVAAAILAALDHRRRTGEGQYIDLSQAEAALHFLAPAILDYGVNGRVAGRVGNRDREHAPHGVYPAAGEDRWIAIAVTDDAEWQALADVMQRPDLASDARFADAAGRRAHADLLDDTIVAWTRGGDMFALQAALQARCVPAHAVANSRELVADPQLRHRGHFVTVEHPLHGPTPVEGSRFILSRTPARIGGAAPTLGRDNDDVLRAILGYDDEGIAALVAAGGLE